MVKASIHMNKICRALEKYAAKRSNKSVVVNVDTKCDTKLLEYGRDVNTQC